MSIISTISLNSNPSSKNFHIYERFIDINLFFLFIKTSDIKFLPSMQLRVFINTENMKCFSTHIKFKWSILALITMKFMLDALIPIS